MSTASFAHSRACKRSSAQRLLSSLRCLLVQLQIRQGCADIDDCCCMTWLGRHERGVNLEAISTSYSIFISMSAACRKYLRLSCISPLLFSKQPRLLKVSANVC
eukprot:748272-Hanusia_phi.AAC.1